MGCPGATSLMPGAFRAEKNSRPDTASMRSRGVPNQLADHIEEALRPVIGTVLATVSVDVEVRRIGKTLESVDQTDLPVIADNLIEALRLVVGPDLAQTAAERVREIA